MSRASKATPGNPDSSFKKSSRLTTKADDSSATPSARTDSELYAEYLEGTEPDLNFPKGVLHEWDEPPVDWEMPEPPDEREIPLDWKDVSTPGTAAGLSTVASISDENLHTQLDSFAAHALNGLLAGMLSVPNTSLDTLEVARMAYNYAEAMMRERQRRLDNQIAPSSPNIEKPGFTF